jgi:prepilin-type N-terminal cleavage/methylation domain-containing protein
MSRRNGFTLVELVVVILILGILAGVAAPKMFNTSAKATDNGLKQTLAIVRDAIELYRAQNGALPGCTGTGADFKLLLKDFVRGPFPKSPVGLQNDQVKPASGNPLVADGTVTGWMYNATTGEFICNCLTASATDPAITYDDF